MDYLKSIPCMTKQLDLQPVSHSIYWVLIISLVALMHLHIKGKICLPFTFLTSCNCITSILFVQLRIQICLYRYTSIAIQSTQRVHKDLILLPSWQLLLRFPPVEALRQQHEDSGKFVHGVKTVPTGDRHSCLTSRYDKDNISFSCNTKNSVLTLKPWKNKNAPVYTCVPCLSRLTH